MAINSITGLEEEEIKVDTSIDTGTTPEITTLPTTLDTSTKLETPTFETPDLGVIQDIKPLESIEEPKIEPIGIPGVTEELPTIPTEPIEPVEPIGTGIEPVDLEIDKLRIEKEKDIKDTFDSFNLAKGQFEEEKDFYINFDDTNAVFEGVLADLRTVQTELGTDLTDEQLQIIATKNGVTLEEVKNPTNIFNKLELTEEGRDKKGVISAEDKITDMETKFERDKEDLAFNLEGQVVSLNNQIEDVKLQLERNIAWAEAQGAFTGGLKSSGYEQGIQNIKDDGQKTIERLQALLERVETADSTNVARLTEDYTKATEQAKKDLDTQLETLKFDTGLQLSGLTEQYGIGSTELTTALDKINEEFGTKSLQVFNDYLTNMRTIQTITNENIIQQDKIDTITETKANKRFNELTANNGQLLMNTGINGLQSAVESGQLSLPKLKDLQNIQLNSITSTLGASGTVNNADLQTIQTLLKQGKTPTEIVAQMQGMDKFKPTEADGTTKRFDLGGGRIRIENADGTIEEFQDGKKIVVTPTSLTEIDFTTNTELINKFPNEASFKNNNPAGITFNLSEAGQNLLTNAGIDFTMGTARPTAEGGNYIKFNTVEDGINAQKVLLSEAGSDDIRSRLEQWVGTTEGPNYATDLMNKAGITDGTQFSNLSDDQLDTLVAVQMQKESPNFYNELVNQFTKAEAPTDEIMGGLGVPIAFERQIKQMVPTQLMNSEIELKSLNETIQILHEAGFSIDEAVLTYMGFDITDEANKEKAFKFVDIARTLGTNLPEDFIPKISNFINKGEDKKAMDLTERVTKRTMSSELAENFIPENVARTGIERADELLILIDKLEASGEEPLGEFEGTIEGWLGKFKSKEAQDVATQAERLVAQFRTDLIGTAGSQTENNNIVNLIPELGDDITNFRIKVSDIGDEALRELNNQREEYGLPVLNIDSLKNKDTRLDLYTGKAPKSGELGRIGAQAGAKLGFGGQQPINETDLFNSLY